MLTELRIKNLALIKDARVSFGPGLNVITGETGAGKTLLVGALNLLLGAKATPAADEVLVQALFAQEGGDTLVSRRVSADGRSRCEVNDDLVTIGKMAETTSSLVSIYGQHQQHLLLSPAKQLALLDGYAGAAVTDDLAALRVTCEAARHARQALEQEKLRDAERVEKVSAIETDLAELEALRPQPGEHATLEEELTLLRHHSQIVELVSAAAEDLSGADSRGAAESLAAAESAISKLPALHESFAQWLARLGSLAIECRDVTSELNAYLREARYDPARIEVVQQRLFSLDQAAKKRSLSPDDLSDHWRELTAAVDHGGVSSTLNELIEELAKLESRKAALAQSLSATRRTAAAGLVKEVMAHFPELGMKEAGIEVDIKSGGEIGPGGQDRVTFLFSANKGHALMELAKVGSGGELSRIMLALRLVEPRVNAVETMVFDEVDTGIGGRTAVRVGEKLARAASGRQAVCVTHLPQVAVFGDRHILVTKETKGGITSASARGLVGAELPAEIARMQGGIQASEISLKAARELLDVAGALKERLIHA